MITARDGMQKVYDLTERVLPSDTDTSAPSTEELAGYLIRTSLRANGFTTLKQLAHLRPGKTLRNALSELLRHAVAAGDVIQLDVPGMPVVYANREGMDTKITPPPTIIRLLSPFDNAVIHRDRIQTLFDFDYRLECYLPAQKRQFGYFSLPILYRDKLVGRADCKAHRQDRQFEIIHLHLGQDTIDLGQFVDSFVIEVRRFAAFNGCDSVKLSKTTPRKTGTLLRRALR